MSYVPPYNPALYPSSPLYPSSEAPKFWNAVSTYLVASIVLIVIYVGILLYKGVPSPLIFSGICLSLCGLLIMTGIIYLINKGSPTAAWIVSGLLIVLSAIALFIHQKYGTLTTTVNGKTVTKPIST